MLYLHAAATNMLPVIAWPLAIGVTAAAMTLVAAWRLGWRAGVAIAVAGTVCLTAGLAGDLAAHLRAGRVTGSAAAPAAHSHAIVAGQQLAGSEIADRSGWHLAIAGGQGMLVAGLAAACARLANSRRQYERAAKQMSAGYTSGRAGSRRSAIAAKHPLTSCRTPVTVTIRTGRSP